MGDLLHHSAQARPLTIAHQGVAACLAVYLADGFEHYEATPDFALLQVILPQAHGDGELAAQLVVAARALVKLFRARVAGRPLEPIHLINVREAVQGAVAAYYRQRAAATHAKIFPETQEVPAHAAE